MLSFVSIEERTQVKHPLCEIPPIANEALSRLYPKFWPPNAAEALNSQVVSATPNTDESFRFRPEQAPALVV